MSFFKRQRIINILKTKQSHTKDINKKIDNFSQNLKITIYL